MSCVASLHAMGLMTRQRQSQKRAQSFQPVLPTPERISKCEPETFLPYCSKRCLNTDSAP